MTSIEATVDSIDDTCTVPDPPPLPADDAMTTEQGTQTEVAFCLDQSSVATQCNLLNAPPLKKLSDQSASLDESFITETEPEENDLDTSIHLSQEECTTE